MSRTRFRADELQIETQRTGETRQTIGLAKPRREVVILARENVMKVEAFNLCDLDRRLLLTHASASHTSCEPNTFAQFPVIPR